MADIDKRKRTINNSDTKLSANIPLPNIVRIEVLNKFARSRYLGTLQHLSNELKDDLVEKLNGPNGDTRSLVFYGFMKGSAPRTIDLSSTWERTGNTGPGILGTVRALVAGGTSSFGENSVIGQALELGRDLTGISMSTTGSSTIKRYSGSELNQFSIDCGWYLPEQYKLCVKSLKAILRIAYPTQLNIEKTNKNSSPVADAIGTILKGTYDTVVTAGKKVGVAALDSLVGNTQEQIAARETEKQKTEIKENIEDPTSKNKNKNTDSILTADNAQRVVGAIINKETIDLFGKNLTFDPLPVRCSIGQFIDIEPMVISNVAISLSNETFINKDGKHLPIFISVNIQLKFWMQPPPNFEFMKLLGEEMFG